MSKFVQQSTANDPLFFFLTSSSDHITGVTGLGSGPSVTLSKNGAAFAAPAGAISEIGSGWYQVAGNATDTNTLGELLLHATGTGADPCDLVTAYIIAFNPRVANINSNVLQINSVALAAQALAQSTQSICWGTCSGGSTTTAIVSTLNNPASLTATGQLIGRTIIFLGNTGTGGMQAQASNITNSTTGATPTITFTTMTTAPGSGDVFVIL